MSEITFSEQIQKKNYMPFCIKMGIFLMFIFVKNIFGISIPVSFFLVLTCFITATGDRDEIITFAICCLPMSTAFQYKYALLICIIVYYIKFSNDIKFNIYVIPLILMMFWELLHAFKGDFSYNEYLRNFTELIFCTFLMINSYKKINYILVYRIMAICTIVMMTIVLVNLLKSTNYDFKAIFSGSYRFGVGNEGVENFGVNYNANGVGSICNMAVTGLLVLISIKRQNVFDYIMIVALLFFGILTKSRSFIICCLILFVMFLFGKKKDVKSFFITIISIAIILVIIYIIMVNYAPFIIEQFVARFQEEDISNGRNDLLLFYNTHINSKLEYMVFGLGLQDIQSKIQDIYKISMNVPHNGIQELLVVWGIPGLIIFLIFIMSIIKSSSRKRTFLNYIPLIILLISVQSGQLIRSGRSLMSLSYVYVVLCMNLKEEKNENTKENFEISKTS